MQNTNQLRSENFYLVVLHFQNLRGRLENISTLNSKMILFFGIPYVNMDSGDYDQTFLLQCNDRWNNWKYMIGLLITATSLTWRHTRTMLQKISNLQQQFLS